MKIKFRIRVVKQEDITVFYTEKMNMDNEKPEWVDISHDTNTDAQVFLSYTDAFHAANNFRQTLLGKKYPNETIYELKTLEIDTDLPEEEYSIAKTPEELKKIADILINKLTKTSKFSSLDIDGIYPTPSINDKIIEAHSYVDNILTHVELFKNSNNDAIRLFVFQKLKERIGNIEIICDETNNTSEVVDNKIVIARVMWNDNRIHKYQDLFFGEERNITKFLLNHMEYRNNENVF